MKKQLVTVDKSVLTIVYPTIGKTFKVDLSKYQQSIQDDARRHGFKQKFGDAASGKSPAEKYDEVQLIHASLMEGNWERTGTVDIRPLVIEAVEKLTGRTSGSIVKEFAAKKISEERQFELCREWATNADTKAEIARIRAERLMKAAESDTSELKVVIS